jgi:hypothetical protein
MPLCNHPLHMRCYRDSVEKGFPIKQCPTCRADLTVVPNPERRSWSELAWMGGAFSMAFGSCTSPGQRLIINTFPEWVDFLITSACLAVSAILGPAFLHRTILRVWSSGDTRLVPVISLNATPVLKSSSFTTRELWLDVPILAAMTVSSFYFYTPGGQAALSHPRLFPSYATASFGVTISTQASLFGIYSITARYLALRVWLRWRRDLRIAGKRILSTLPRFNWSSQPRQPPRTANTYGALPQH